MVISVTRLNGSVICLNAELIQSVEGTPDTVITLTNGAKWVVRESPDEIVERVVGYRRRIHPSADPGDRG